MAFNYLQSLNALYSIFFSVDGSVTLSSALSWKTPSCKLPSLLYSSTPSTPIPSLSTARLSLAHRLNAPYPTVLTEPGIMIFLSPLPRKAYFSIAYRPLFIIADYRGAIF